MIGAVNRVTVSLGPRSTIHLAPVAARPSTSATQSTGFTKMVSVSSRVSSRSRPVRAAHSLTRSTPAARRGVWNPTSTLSWLKIGRKIAPPRVLFLRSASSFSVIFSQYSSKRANCSGVPVMTTERRPLRIDKAGANTVRTSWANSSRSSAIRAGSTLRTDTIGALSPRPTIPQRRETSDPAAPISCPMASSSTSRVPRAFNDSTAVTPCE